MAGDQERPVENPANDRTASGNGQREEEVATAVPPPLAPDRRRFLGRLSAALGAIATGVLVVPWLVFLLSPAVRRDPREWRPVGRAEDFRIGETVRVTYMDPEPLPWAGFAARSAAWLRRDSETEFIAFTLYCTHVGCPVRWEEGAQLFMCPCHGGAFYRDGQVAAGPPIRPLDRYPVRVRNGTVEVQAVGVPVPLRLT